MAAAKYKDIAYKPNTVSKEKLPFPIVLYPGHYGAFFAFKKNEHEKAYCCSCAYEAIENYIELKYLSPNLQYSHSHKMYVLDSSNFPLSLVEDLMNRKVSVDGILASLNFEEALCHECNRETPSYRYCHEMYGGVFKQNYGWYIRKQAFEWGINSLFLPVLPGRCPEEILDEIKVKTPVVGSSGSAPFQDANNENDKVTKIIREQKRKIRNIIENEVRSKFGHKNVGEAWSSETILYYLVKNLFPQHKILRHYRPDFLEGLELDIYIDEANIGIEYQGIQHYKPIKHWGGKDALEKVKKRDKRKRDICKDYNIPVIYFEYNEGLSRELVQKKLEPFM